MCNERVGALMDPRARWEANLHTEIHYWNENMRTRGLQWPDAWREVVTPNRPLQQEYRDLLPASGPVRILDVGAGPYTHLGTVWEGREVEVIAVDPLADEYDRLMLAHQLEPTVRTRKCAGEDLCALFPPDSFDLVLARNSLDHAYDPLAIVRNMVAVCKPGGVVQLLHSVREADKENGEGLHQWNFFPHEGQFFIERHGESERVNVTEALAHAASVEVSGEGWFVATLRKKTA